MTDKHDSSAPNSPELTRLSGEQAEERTAREGLLGNLQKLDAAMAENGFMFCCGEHQHDKNCWLAEVLATTIGVE